MPKLSKYQTDELFLLIGGNPLPNYVAASLLTRPHAHVHLLHTGGPTTTIHVAERLRDLLTKHRPDLRFDLREIDRTDGHQIESRVKGIVGDIGRNRRVGLNYTGGMKPMAVHAYHVIRNAFPDSVFSYLDAERLALVVRQGSRGSNQIFVGDTMRELDFEDLFTLHNYELTQIRTEFDHDDLARALIDVHLTREGHKAWYDYRRETRVANLPRLEDYPALEPVIDVFQAWGGEPADVADRFGFPALTSCASWFKGTWLEVYTYEELTSVADDLSLQALGWDITALLPSSPRGLQLDVAALYGYQLFGISCIVSDRTQSVKDHLFEVYNRAHQLGGDEARAAVVSMVENPGRIQQELNFEWDVADKIRVFGREHLLDLASHLETWVHDASLR